MALEKLVASLFQDKSCKYMTFLLIHSPTKENPNATLEETFFSKQSNLRIFKIFGCAIYDALPSSLLDPS
jgi:hypothetical protein